MKERLVDLYICIIVSVLLRLLIRNDVIYFVSCFGFGVVYGTYKGVTK